MPILEWAMSAMDSSRLSTFVISILIIVYGCFRSMNMEQEQKNRERDKQALNTSFNSAATLWTSQATETENGGRQTMSVWQALFMPLGASISLLVMFLFFDALQHFFAVCIAFLAMAAFAFLLLPLCQFLVRQFCNNNRVQCGCFGRFTQAECLAFCLSFIIVCIWVLTGHWLLMDALGMGLCVALIALVQLPSLKVSTLLLLGLLMYDVFWVFFSSYLFNANVMVRVATRQAENPLGVLARKLHLFSLSNSAPKLSLPGKLVFPSLQKSGRLSMLGLGDIVMPGLLLCFVLRFDAHKRSQATSSLSSMPESVAVSSTAAKYCSRVSYFQWSLVGYFLGLMTSIMSSEFFQAAQPALLYLVPFTLLPLHIVAYLKGDLRRMWTEPFRIRSPVKFVEV